MKYQKVIEGKFVDRPNRFIAHVKIDGELQTVHVKNTGRCRELAASGCSSLSGSGRQSKTKDSI